MKAPRRTRIKFCGLMSKADIALAVAAGVDAIGIIVAESPRRVALDGLAELSAAVPAFVTKVGVMAAQGEREAAALRGLGFTLQFSGDETAEQCERLAGGCGYLKAFHVRPEERSDGLDLELPSTYRNATWMFDSRIDARYGGTGVPFIWKVVEATAASHPVVISGGLTPDNVAACVRSVRPYAVDVRNGIESAGAKDPAKMLAFVNAVRQADAEVAMHASSLDFA